MGFVVGVSSSLLATAQVATSLLHQGACSAQLMRSSHQLAASWLARANVPPGVPCLPPSRPQRPGTPSYYAGLFVASALAGGVIRGAVAAGRLAAPVVMALLKALALSRLFA